MQDGIVRKRSERESIHYVFVTIETQKKHQKQMWIVEITWVKFKRIQSIVI